MGKEKPKESRGDNLEFDNVVRKLLNAPPKKKPAPKKTQKDK